MFENHNPSSITEEQDAEEKLYRISSGFDVINIIIHLLPEWVTVCVVHEETIQHQSNDNLDDHLKRKKTPNIIKEDTKYY